MHSIGLNKNRIDEDGDEDNHGGRREQANVRKDEVDEDSDSEDEKEQDSRRTALSLETRNVTSTQGFAEKRDTIHTYTKRNPPGF